MKRLSSLLTLIIMSISILSTAQNYNMTNGNITSCSGTFYDSGGTGNYSNGESLTFTICPDIAGAQVTVDFSVFEIENNFDDFTIYDGNTTAAPTLGTYTGTAGPGFVAATTGNTSGCLTFVFESDGSVTDPGWVGNIGCINDCQDIIANGNFSPAPDADGIIRICQGETISMNGSGTYPDNNSSYFQSDATSSFEWSIDGNIVNGQNVSYTFPNAGAFYIQLEITDTEGCSNANDIDQLVYVSTTPIFTGTAGAPDPICLGDQANFTGVVNPVTYEQECIQPSFPPISLPDGSGVTYETSVNLDCYGPNQQLTDINDLLSLCVNMEHSFMGDLEIAIECPSGQTIILVDYPNGGGGTYLGVPIDDDTQPAAQGTGFQYCWEPNSTNGTWSDNTGGTLPAGSYESDNAMSGLVGCDLNGDWTLLITDNLGSDNGFIFDWSLNFDPGLAPPAFSFTPSIVSESWQADPTIVSGTNPITVEPTSVGSACYTYEVTDNFGCTYDTTVCITVDPSPLIDPIADITDCNPVTLPNITGTDLTGNQAYFTGANGTGTQYGPGDVISTTTTLYVYDAQTVAPFCSDEESFTITITNPILTLNCPGPLTAICDVSEQPSYTTYADFQAAGGSASTTAGANILPATFTMVSEISDGNSCPEIVTRTYQIEDDCGNIETCTQTINVDDNIAPVFAAAPGPISVECIGDLPAMTNLGWTDNCDGTGSVAGTDGALAGGPCGGTITRTWTYTDACGNPATATQTITIDDTTPPVFAAAPADVTVECIGDVPAMTNLGWTDNCDGAGTVAGTDGALAGGSCGGTITRTWTYTDACGNPATATQIITVDDTAPPVFAAAPADVTVECIGDVPAMTNLGWTDNCDGAGTVAGTDGALVGGSCGGTITRTWTYTDACGNPATATQTITIDDTTPPVFAAAPADVTVECIGDVPAMTNLGWTDNCDGTGTVAGTDGALAGGSCGGTITRTWTYTDACGNLATATQIITIDDNTAPVFAAAPADLTVECIGDVPAMTNLGWTDNCDGAGTVAGTDGALAGGSCGGTITRTWTYTDACGNAVTATQTITVDDNIPPTASNPATTTVECATDVPVVDETVVNDEADNCTVAPTVTFLSEVSDNNVCNGEQIVRTYEIADDCGNTTTVTHTIIIDSYTPTFTVAGTDPTVCGGTDGFITISGLDPNTDYSFSYNGGATSVITTDGAGEYVITGLGAGSYTGFTVSDADCPACSTTDGATITLTDPNPPAIDAGFDQQVCEGDQVTLTANNPDGATITWDNGITDGTAFTPAVGTTTYTVTANLAGCINSDAVNVTVAPTIDAITCPGGLAAVCDIAEQPAYADFYAFIADGGSATIPAGGEIDTASFVMLSEVSDGLTCPETVTRTYQIEDTCGVTVTCTQTIVINDLIDPTGTAPIGATYACLADVPAASAADITDEADNCTAAPTVVYNGETTSGGGCPITITRTWDISDDCGNTITVTQTITVNDTQAPTIAGTATIITDEGCTVADATAPVTTVADLEAMGLTIDDNCTADANLTVSSTETSAGTCPIVITRTYTVTDECGNATTINQTLNVNDTQAPTASNPATTTVECATDVPAVDETVVTDEADNCTAAPTVTFLSEVSDNNVCDGEQIVRTYQIADDCGNTTTVTHTIIIDSYTPTFTVAGTDPTVCGGTDGFITISGLDPNTDYSFSYNGGATSVITTDGAGEYVITGLGAGSYTGYTVSDADCPACSTTDGATITLTDPNPPAIDAGVDVQVCEGDQVTLTANNPDGATITWDNGITDGTAFTPAVGTTTYTVTANLAGCINSDAVNVTVAPTIDALTCPGGLTAVCDITEQPSYADFYAFIADGGSATIPAGGEIDTASFVMLSEVSDGLTCPETVTRTYQIADTCGVTVTCTQTIVINDLIDPTGTAPIGATYACLADVPAASAADITDEADNCTVSPTVVYNGETTSGGGCPITITRTWDISDDCGNTITVTQTITVNDTQAPTITGTATIITDEGCTVADATAPVTTVADLEAMGLTIDDNCTADANLTVSSTETDAGTCPIVITRVYTVTDECGNSTTVNQTLEVNDTQAPTASNPATTTVECATDVPVVDETVVNDEADNCTVAPTVTFLSEVSDNNVCNGEQIVRTYQIADDCGNTTTVTHTIIIDSYTPTFTVAGTDPSACGATDGFITISGLDPNTDYSFSYNGGATSVITTDGAGEYVITGLGAGSYTGFTVSDADCPACSTTDGATITLTDPNPPAIDAGVDVQVCEGDQVTLTANNPDGATITWDNGITDGTAFTPAVGTTTYTVTANLAGCISSDAVNVTVAPTIDALTCPGGLTAVCDITEQPAYADFYAFIADGGSATIPAGGEIDTASFVMLSEVSDGLTCPETVTRTYQIADTCGVTVTCTQTIVINDLINPTASAPAPVTVQCVGDIPAIDETVVNDEADNCTATPAVTHVGDATDGNTCPETITRTYRITDDCGNFIEVDQIITVNDDIDPTASAPAPVAVQCIGDVPVEDVTVITDEADNCTATPIVSHVGDATDGLSCPETITRTYRVEDACGNFIEVDQIITVNDDIAPTASNPATTTVECATDVPAVDETVINDEADNCTAAPTVTFLSEVSDNNVCDGEQIVRTYQIEDDCGNTTTVTHTIIIDSYTPTFTLAGTDPTVCGGTDGFITISGLDPNTDYSFSYNGGATSVITTDGAGEYVITGLGAGSYTGYTVSDADCPACSTTDGATITLTDPNPPAIDAGVDQQVCEGDQVTLTANNPDGATITWDNGITDGTAFTPAVGTTTYTVTANLAGCISSDAVNVTVAPTIDALTCPGGLTAVCDITEQPAYADFYAFIADGGSATIPAGGEIDTASFVMLSEVSDGLTCPETVTRTYQIADTCGVTVTCTQTIVINDLINPTASAPAPVSVQCIGDVPAIDETVVNDEADNCTATPAVTHVGDASDGNTCPETITRTYRITDDCGNFIEVDQIITVNDDIDPTASAPAPVAVQCIGDVPVEDVTVITDEADNCTAAPAVTHVGDVSDGNTCPEVITRTYRIEDACGNFIEVDQIITVNDDIAPTASNPATTTVLCATDVPAVDETVVTDEADNCTVAPTVTFISETSDNNVCNGEELTRVYEIADDCGNTTTVTHTIIIDSYTPTFTVAGTDPTTCGGTDGFITISGLDANTDYLFEYNGNAQVTITTDGAGEYVITGLGEGNYTGFTVSDADCPACSTTDGATITLTDPNPPAIDAGVDVQVCEGDQVTLTANNPDGATITWDNGITDGTAFTPAVGTTTYTVTANLAGCISSDAVNVTVAPTIDAITCPGGLTAVCDITEQPAYADFYAFIADGGSATIPAGGEIDTASFVMLSEVSDGLTCPETVTRTYQIADTCGVTVTCTQTIVINDLINPTASAPAPVTVQCVGDIPAIDETVVNDEADNCTATPAVTHVGDATDGNTCPETITRTYRITDDCGNFIEVDQIITVNDDIDPTASAPAPVAVQCIGDVPVEDVTVITDEADNCTAAPAVTHVGDVSDGNTCPEVITRTYRVEDACGNFIEVDQIITVNDDIAPTASNPATTTVECATDVPVVDETVVNDEADNCTAAPTVTFISETSDNNVCNGEELTRVYEIADDCGNTTTVTHTIIIDSYTPTFTVAGTDPTKCGGTDGFITISGLDANTGYLFEYNGNAQVTITTDGAGEYVITGLGAGSYTGFTVSDADCPTCSTTDGATITLTDPIPPVIDAGPDQEVCEGTEVTLTADNPDGANISWDNGITDGTPFTPGVGTINYTVTAELNDCISTDLVIVTVNPLPIVNAGNDITICEGEQVTLSGSGAASYVWDNGVTNGVAFTPSTTTTYTVTGTSVDGCVNTDDVVVTVNPNPIVAFEADTTIGCVPLTVNFTNLTEGSSIECVYTFSDGTQLIECNPTHTFTTPGCYDVTLEVTNNNGCASTITIQDYICVDAYPIADFTVDPEELTNLNNTAQFANNSSGASTYEWQFGDGATSTVTNPEHTYPSTEDGDYEVQLIAYSDLGCPDTVTTVLPLREELLFYVPNTFTPDGNKFNQTFKPIFTSGFDPQDYTLLIFNRWGEKIFESKNASKGWDGTYGAGGQDVVQDGTYVWKIVFKTKYDDERKVEVGHVNVLK